MDLRALCGGGEPGVIARELNDRGEVTGSGKLWQGYAVRSVLDSRHVTGIRVFRGEDAGKGTTLGTSPRFKTSPCVPRYEQYNILRVFDILGRNQRRTSPVPAGESVGACPTSCRAGTRGYEDCPAI